MKTVREYGSGCGARRVGRLRKSNGFPADEIPIGFVVTNLARSADRVLTFYNQPLDMRGTDTADIYDHRVFAKTGEFDGQDVVVTDPMSRL